MKIDKPLVSVIMPAYNVEKYIAKSINSVLNQTYSHFELIIINDGSPDNSFFIANEIGKFDNRISIYTKENGGLSDARNFGLKKAKGEFIYFIDSDDWIEKNLLEIAINTFKETNCELLVFGCYLDFEDDHDNVSKSFIINSENSSLKRDELKDVKINKNVLNLLGYAWNKLYRRESIFNSKITFDKGISLVEDMVFNAKVYKQINYVHIINIPLYHYIQRDNNTLIRKFHENSFDLIILKHNNIKSFLSDWNFDKKIKNKLLANNLMLGIYYCSMNLFKYVNNLTFFDKKKFIYDMLNNNEVEKYIKHYKSASLKDVLMKFLVTYKMHKTLSTIYHFKSLLK